MAAIPTQRLHIPGVDITEAIYDVERALTNRMIPKEVGYVTEALMSIAEGTSGRQWLQKLAASRGDH